MHSWRVILNEEEEKEKEKEKGHHVCHPNIAVIDQVVVQVKRQKQKETERKNERSLGNHNNKEHNNNIFGCCVLFISQR